MATAVDNEKVRHARLLSTDQVCDILNISKPTLWVWLARKTDPIPSFKIGRFRRFSLDQLNWWIEKHAS